MGLEQVLVLSYGQMWIPKEYGVTFVELYEGMILTIPDQYVSSVNVPSIGLEAKAVEED